MYKDSWGQILLTLFGQQLSGSSAPMTLISEKNMSEAELATRLGWSKVTVSEPYQLWQDKPYRRTVGAHRRTSRNDAPYFV